MKLPILKAPLSQEIQREYDKLINLIVPIPVSSRILKQIDGTGIKGESPIMPGEGFSTWDYTAIARHFYQKYQYHHNDEQNQAFHQLILQLLGIVEKEYESGNLDQVGVWPWCTLQSGKQWPLSKWIKINTSSPYKRASQLIKKA